MLLFPRGDHYSSQLMPLESLFDEKGLIPLPISPAHPLSKQLSAEFNSHKYRSDEFTTRSDFNIMFLGDSWTFGFGVEKEERFSTRLCRALGATEWNLGTPGTSRESMSRLTYSATPVLKPDLAIVVFTAPARREHIGPNFYMQYKRKSPFAKCSREVKWLLRHYGILDSRQNNEANAYWQYKWIETTFDRLGVEWYYSTCLSEDYPEIGPSRFIGTFDKIDLGDDNSHPGRNSHKRFFQKALSMVKRQPQTQKVSDQNYHNTLWEYLDEDIYYEFTPGKAPDDFIPRRIHRAFKTTCTPERTRMQGLVSAGLTENVTLDMLKKWRRSDQNTPTTK